MQAITITQITPPELETLIENSIKKVLSTKKDEPHSEVDQWFDLEELVKYDPEKRKKPTFYSYIQHRLIPFHKRGKKLIFLKSEIDLWLKSGRKKTNSEIEAEAESFLQNRKTKSLKS